MKSLRRSFSRWTDSCQISWTRRFSASGSSTAAWPSPSAEGGPTCPPTWRSSMDEARTTEIPPADHDIESRVREEAARDVSQDRARRFYDRIRTSIHEFTEGKGVVGKTAEYLMLVPDMFMLL